MQFSGYDQRFRSEVVKSALQAHKKILSQDEKGEKPLYRPKEWNRIEREKNRRAKKGTWFKKGGYESVVFIPATPKSELKKKYENEIKKTDLKIRVVEKSGRSLKSMLQKSDPFKQDKCADVEGCVRCKSDGRGKGMCRRDNITYEMECDKCQYVYIGESARNVYSRGIKHEKDLSRKDKKSVLYRHVSSAHDKDDNVTFTTSVTGSYTDALTRQLSEAVKINNDPRTLINNKSEFHHPPVPRVQLTVG